MIESKSRHASDSQFPLTEAPRKPSKWRYLFIILGTLQILGAALFLLAMMSAVQQANAGMPGTEFTGLFLLVIFVPPMGFIALINLIGLPIYIFRHKPRGVGLALSIVSLVISLVIVLYGVYVYF